MFTGIVEEQGRVESLTLGEGDADARLSIRASAILDDLTIGASVAVNGVCLTVTSITGAVLSFDVMPQTLQVSSLGDLHPGDSVNLERAMAVSGRFDGHIVQGHVDGVAVLKSRQPGPRWDALQFTLPVELSKYVVPQGSITVAGVSLTVTEITQDHFGVALIPTTLDVTTLGCLTPGDRVNIEVDVLAKYVERMMDAR
ncbi:MAG: riboflavin synthase [Cellulomonadaceae bacterium]|jgi:riboflavin synthase|nr:riboflavin synthase [Cellulomonadaceae bacterium]